MAALTGGLALWTTGCAGSPECGPGTVEVDDTCVTAEDSCTGDTVYDPETKRCEGVTCAEGTSLVEGECVPDGSVICGDGTTYVEETGTCEPDIGGCAEGTVLVEGECVPYDDSLTGDVEEMDEPNDVPDDNAGLFDVPATGEAVTIHGCIEPYTDADGDGELDADYDAYYLQVSAPTLLDVTVDGLGGLAGGFVALAGDPQLADDGWARIGVSLVDDTASRQVYLPKAGVYAFQIGDSRTIITGAPAGGPTSCYFATVTGVAIPAPTPITSGTVEGSLGNDVQFFSYDPAEGALLLDVVDVPSQSAAAALIHEVNDVYYNGSPFVDNTEPTSSLWIGGLADDDELVVVVDPTVNFALSPVDFALTVNDADVAAAPADGGSVTLTNDAALWSNLYFEAAAGDVIRAQVDGPGGALSVAFTDRDGAFIGMLCSGCVSADEWLHVTESGRYYLAVYDNDLADGVTYDVSVTRDHVQPTPLTVDTPLAGETVADELTNWYSADLGASTWVATTGDPAGFTGDLEYVWYDLGQSGVIGESVPGIDGDTLADAADESGRIVYETETPQVLIAVRDDGGAVAGTSFDFAISNRDYVDLGTIDAANLPDMTDVMLDAGTSHHYFGLAAEFSRVPVTATPAGSANLVLAWLDREESALAVADEAGANGAETLETTAVGGWIAFSVDEQTGAAAIYDLTFAHEDPVSYSAAATALPFTSVCPADGGAGVDHPLTGSDDGLSATALDLSGLSSPFSLYGQAASELTISSNGWLTTETGYSGDSFLSASFGESAPNAVVAPFWEDLSGVSVCTQVASDRVVVQWDGAQWATGDVSQFQAVLHTDGSIDFIYGPDHVDTATAIGVEGPYGARAEIIADGQAGFAAPNTSWTLSLD